MAMVVRANRDKATPGPHIDIRFICNAVRSVTTTFSALAQMTTQVIKSISRAMHHPECMHALCRRTFKRRTADNFRRELQPGGGLSSYPTHGLCLTFAISHGFNGTRSDHVDLRQALSYLENRGLKQKDDGYGPFSAMESATSLKHLAPSASQRETQQFNVGH